ncbi:MAG: hypothetical protein HY326_08100 [Chloroflexi bacterium]|nr:hypothetical protein [Chloroflexota bacterium]
MLCPICGTETDELHGPGICGGCWQEAGQDLDTATVALTFTQHYESAERQDPGWLEDMPWPVAATWLDLSVAAVRG